MDSLKTVLDEMMPFHVRQWANRHPHTEKIIVEVPTMALLVSILGVELTVEDAMTIFDLDSVNASMESRRTLSINKEKECIVFQNVPAHKKPRDATIIYFSGQIVNILGSEYIKKRKC